MITIRDFDAEPAGAPELEGRASGMMRNLNHTLRSLSAHRTQAEPIAFFCECGLDTCFTTIWKTKTDFDAMTEERENWILADGHRASTPFADEPAGLIVDEIAESLLTSATRARSVSKIGDARAAYERSALRELENLPPSPA